MNTTIILKNANPSILEDIKSYLQRKNIVFSLEKENSNEEDAISKEMEDKIIAISKKINKKGTQKMLESIGLDYDSYIR